jgi:lactoylglutathione lyase
MTESTTSTRVTRMHAVAVPVRDQDLALEFYTGILGLQKTMDVDMGGGTRWIEVAPAAGGTTIALASASPNAPAGVETGIRLRTEDVDALHAHLLAHGVSADDVLRWPGVPPMFAFRDQDGNGLVIIAES